MGSSSGQLEHHLPPRLSIFQLLTSSLQADLLPWLQACFTPPRLLLRQITGKWVVLPWSLLSLKYGCVWSVGPYTAYEEVTCLGMSRISHSAGVITTFSSCLLKLGQIPQPKIAILMSLLAPQFLCVTLWKCSLEAATNKYANSGFTLFLDAWFSWFCGCEKSKLS